MRGWQIFFLRKWAQNLQNILLQYMLKVKDSNVSSKVIVLSWLVYVQIYCLKHNSFLHRYLIQTIRNFNKPIAAVIKKTAVGLPASLLSLFDMVFDEVIC